MFDMDVCNGCMDIYKSLNIYIGTVMKNTEILKFVPDKMVEH